MKRIWPTILRFVLIFALVLTVLAVAWTWLVPPYTATVASLAKPVFRLAENPDVTIVDVRHDEIWILRDIGEGRAAPFNWFDRYTFFAVIPLLALLVATPGLGWRRLAIRTAAGLALLMVSQALYLVVSVELSYAAMGLIDLSPFAARTLDAWQIMVRVLWEAIPILIWLTLTFDAWRRMLARMREGAGERQDDPTRSDVSGLEKEEATAHGEGRLQ